MTVSFDQKKIDLDFNLLSNKPLTYYITIFSALI